jgi:hypothetical protein
MFNVFLSHKNLGHYEACWFYGFTFVALVVFFIAQVVTVILKNQEYAPVSAIEMADYVKDIFLLIFALLSVIAYNVMLKSTVFPPLILLIFAFIFFVCQILVIHYKNINQVDNLSQMTYVRDLFLIFFIFSTLMFYQVGILNLIKEDDYDDF